MGKGLLAGFFLFLAGLGCLAQAPTSGFPPGVFQTRGAIDGGVAAPCSQYTAYVARATGMDTAHNGAFQTLICNGVSQGWWAKLDVFYVFATDTSAHALLNLVSSSFNGTANGAPSFTTDRGYTGVDASTTVYIDSGFNPSTAGGQYAQNSAHASVWGGNNVQAGALGGGVIGNFNVVGTVLLDMAPWTSSNNFTAYINAGTTVSVANTTSLGHYITNRSGASAVQLYKNGASVTTGTPASSALINATVAVLAVKQTTGTAVTAGSAIQVMVATVGSSLSSTDSTNMCHEENTFLNTIAGVSSGVC